MERPTLKARLARLERRAGPSLQEEPAAAKPLFPSKRLQVLLPHRDEPELAKIDLFARRIFAPFRRAAKPQKRLSKMAADIAAQRKRYEGLSKPDFAKVIADISERSKFDHSGARRQLGALEIDAFAVLAEAVFRVNGFYPFREQFMAAIALLEAQIAEMATGEGKTITATMAAIVAAWRGLPCHVITSNDYLAARDCELGQPLFGLCGVSATVVNGDTDPSQRGAGYSHDIVYTTAKDMLADHLRDDIVINAQADRYQFCVNAMSAGISGAGQGGGVTMRGVYQLVVDEADSVLIDDAVTPLIISEPTPDTLLNEVAQGAVAMARSLKEGVDFKSNIELKTATLTKQGRKKLRDLSMNAGPFWQSRARSEEFVQLALHAMYVLQKDKHYVIEEDKVVLIDELTGRLARQRTLSLGLHQVLEASLDLPLSDPSEVKARLSFQRYFRRLPKLGGMTGTAREARDELQSVYGLSVVEIPTHRKTRRRKLGHKVFRNEAAKFRAVALRAQDLSQKGHAVLIGVRSVQTSHQLCEAFKAHTPQLDVKVLNAINDSEESALVALAGQSGAVTVATNMAGRGTDIKIDETVHKLGGLHVLIAESNDFGRIDRQLEGRCARQGDPGVVQRFISMDEEVVRRFLPVSIKRLWKIGHGSGVMRGWLAYRMVRIAQARAEKFASAQRAMSLKVEIETERKMI